MPKIRKKNNEIRALVKPSQVRLVNLDFDSPRMKMALAKLGFEQEDLESHKRREDFYN